MKLQRFGTIEKVVSVKKNKKRICRNTNYKSSLREHDHFSLEQTLNGEPNLSSLSSGEKCIKATDQVTV